MAPTQSRALGAKKPSIHSENVGLNHVQPILYKESISGRSKWTRILVIWPEIDSLYKIGRT